MPYDDDYGGVNMYDNIIGEDNCVMMFGWTTHDIFKVDEYVL